jgi:aspartate/methionine/tyrosine aminotransferase
VLLDSLTKAQIPYPQPAGAFFAFADIRATGLSSADFAVKVLNEAHVLIFPGTQYGPGGEGFLRISYLADPAEIETAVAKIGGIYRALVDSK